MISSHNY